MKRWMVFLIVFAIGLGILIWIQTWLGPKQQGEAPLRTPAPPSPLTPVRTGEDLEQGVGAAVSGPLNVRRFDVANARVVYEVKAQDTRSVGGDAYDLTDVRYRLFQRDGERTRLEIDAASARAMLKTHPATSFDEQAPIALRDVEVRVPEGMPLSPLRVRVPSLEGIFAEEHFTSTELVEITGRGLRATGVGFDFLGTGGSARLVSHAQVDLTLASGMLVRLTAANGLSVRKLPDAPPGSVEIDARGSAELHFGGERPLNVWGDAIKLFGRAPPEDPNTFLATHAVADGHVRLMPTDGIFAGDHAEVQLSELGAPVSATLEGQPQIELVLRDVQDAQLPLDVPPSQSDLPVNASGAGPLTLTLTGTPSFDFQGPATLVMPSLDATLTAQQRLRGSHVEGSAYTSLTAEGGTTATLGKSRLVTDQLVLSRSLENGAPAGHLVATGSTVSDGVLEDGSQFHLLAREGLEYTKTPRSFLVPRAEGVEVEVRGTNGFKARAKHLSDFDGSDLSFVAQGEVEFENAEGSGSGDRLDAHGRRRAELTGSPTRKAHYRFQNGEIESDSVEYDGDRVSARHGVRTRLELEQRRYALESSWLDLTRAPDADDPKLSSLDLEAGGEVVARLEDSARLLTLSSSQLSAKGRARADENGRTTLAPGSLVASGGVEFAYQAGFQLAGGGERLDLDEDGAGRLSAAPEGRVHLEGTLPGDRSGFRMSGHTVGFSPEHVEAVAPEIEIQGVKSPIASGGWSLDSEKALLTVRRAETAPPGAAPPPEVQPPSDEAPPKPEEHTPLRVIAGAVHCDRSSILFTDGVYLGQAAPPIGEPEPPSPTPSPEGGAAEGEARPQAGPKRGVELFDLLAWGGCSLRFGPKLRARGASLYLDSASNLLSLIGAPAEITTPAATLVSNWFDWSLLTGFLKSGKGHLEFVQQGQPPLTLSYESLEPVEGPDSTVQVVREPVLDSGDRKLRASWALFWVDTRKWAALTQGGPGPEAQPAPPVSGRPPGAPSLFAELDHAAVREWLREVYFEGNIEFLMAGERRVRAEALYVDLVDGHGWVRDVDFSMPTPFSARTRNFKLHADWLRHSRDGSFRAERAVVTTCDFDVPHYEIQIGNLTMKPRPSRKAKLAAQRGETSGLDETDGWNIGARNNAITFPNGFHLPLPQFALPMAPDFSIPKNEISVFGVRPLSFGSNAKFGTFVGFTIVQPLGWVAKQIDRLLVGKSPDLPEGETNYSPSYRSSRGPMLSIESTIRSEGRYWLVTNLDLVYDTGRDKGLVRVPEGDRDSFRDWFHARGRYLVSPTEWVDLVLTRQSDPGVQAEFFERDFLRYEQRENYLHWRKANGVTYWSATAEARLESFRTEVVDEPSLGFYRGRAPVGKLWGHPLLYSSNSSLAHLNRYEGDPNYEPPFPDGLGEREVLRLDTDHRLESPMPLGALGLTATPFVESRVTAWDRGLGPGNEPTRIGVIAGVDLTTTFWRRFSGGSLHELTPLIGVRGDLGVDEQGAQPVRFDSVEDPLEGRFVDVGFRSRWSDPAKNRFMDVEVRETHADGVAPGEPSGWLPVRVNGSWLASLGSMPFGITHDARYDVSDPKTVYSRTFVGVEPIPPLEVEMGYHSATDAVGDTLYSAYSLAARYDFSEKWALEGRETISTLSASRLSSSITVRRFGHDFVFEIEASVTAGEGSSVDFNLVPLLTYRQPHLGLLDRWRSQD
jgi:hypothetical protein